ncbi:hypothetical protein JKG68_01930 [Microvirga aerilata]|uniref:Uncharacterized protein n=1 Tax=Microvirga aerilata TaxID=670292 RepID=A0A937CW26_9HYPH|nr:hypothetical protein [Microvirga aerilata]MBL0402718.1 hypothetical protein [Microvirga aerilata]
MLKTDQITLTLYPLWMVWAGRTILYLALMMGPIIEMGWIEALLPSAIQETGKIVLGGVALPALYISLYALLHRIGAHCQNFVFLVALLYGATLFAEAQRALSTGSLLPWLGTIGCFVYALGFTWLGYQGYLANRKRAAAALFAEREAQIDMHAEAILRAQQLQRNLSAVKEGP